MRTGHGRDSPLSPAETVSAPRLPRDSHTLARAPRLGILNSVGRSFNVISGETEAQCVQGDLHKAGDNLQLTPVTPGSRTPVQSTTPRSPPKLFFGSIFSINHLTFSFFSSFILCGIFQVYPPPKACCSFLVEQSQHVCSIII